MIRPATPADLPAIEAFLAPRAATSMFLRSNIARHGVEGGDHPHATRIHISLADGAVRAVFGRTSGGMLMLQAPDDYPAIADWAGTLRGAPVAGMTGDPGQIAVLRTAIALPAGRVARDVTEPLMTLALDHLPGLPSGMSLRPADAADIPLLSDWFAGYLAETGLVGLNDDPRTRAAAAPGGSTRLLVRDGRPVAMAALNARAGTDVQVGGVYTPPPLRGRGLARTAIATLLAEAQAHGAARAFLFSNNDAATRAYAALGFATTGSYRIVLLSP
jgi:predicted GNAT family acetyltransferase